MRLDELQIGMRRSKHTRRFQFLPENLSYTWRFQLHDEDCSYYLKISAWWRAFGLVSCRPGGSSIRRCNRSADTVKTEYESIFCSFMRLDQLQIGMRISLNTHERFQFLPENLSYTWRFQLMMKIVAITWRFQLDDVPLVRFPAALPVLRFTDATDPLTPWLPTYGVVDSKMQARASRVDFDRLYINPLSDWTCVLTLNI
jgi:hypothetical protein